MGQAGGGDAPSVSMLSGTRTLQAGCAVMVAMFRDGGRKAMMRAYLWHVQAFRPALGDTGNAAQGEGSNVHKYNIVYGHLGGLTLGPLSDTLH